LGAYLELSGVRTIHIDAWKTDYLEDPLMAFISATNARLEEFSRGDESVSERASIAISSLATAGVKIIAPIAKVLTAALLPGGSHVIDAAGEAVQDIGSFFLQKERESRALEDDFRRSLENARDVLTNRRDGPIKSQVVVIIDELDRCRPHYAIKVLERIKHFFSIPGLVFIVATDARNLPAAIATVYGEKTDGEMYLRKFIDFEYDLPEPKASQFVPVLAREFGLTSLSAEVPPDAIAHHSGASLGPENYKALVERYGRALDVAEIIECFPAVASAMRLQPRDQAQAFTMLNAYVRSAPPSTVIVPRVLAISVGLRFYRPDLYRILKGGLGFNDIFIEGDTLLGRSAVIVRTGFRWDVEAFVDVESASDPKARLIAGMQAKIEAEADLAKRDAYTRIWARAGTSSKGLKGTISRALSLADSFAGD